MIISISYMLREIMAEKTRFFLILLAIAWGTASITGMLAVGEGLRLTFSRAMAGAGQALLYVTSGQTTKLYRGQAINQAITLMPQDLQILKHSIPTIQILPEYNISIKLIYRDKKIYTSLSGVEPAYGKWRNINPQPGGRFINALDIEKRNQVIVLGDELAKKLFPNNRNPIGLFIFADQQRFQVIGIMKKKLQFTSYGMPDSYSAWIPASTYIGLVLPKSIDQFVVLPTDPKKMATIKQTIIKVIALNHHADPLDKNVVSFLDSYATQQKADRIFIGMEIFLGIVGALTLLVAGVGVANVMFISINSATREIGIRIAVGARSYQILWQYIIEALLTTALGGIVGLTLAKIIIFGVAQIPVKQEFLKFIGAPKPVMSSLVTLIAIIVLGLVGFLAGFFPAKKAADIHPAEALRYE